MKSNIFLLFFVLSLGFAYSQKQEGEYLVFLLQKSNKNELHKGDTYIWVVPKDSVGLKNAAPFYIKDFSKTALTKCADGKAPRLFILSQSDEWNFSESEKNAQVQIEHLLKSNQQKIATASIEAFNYKDIITVNVVAIKGGICKCPINNEEGKLIGFDGSIFLALENLKVIPISIRDLDISKVLKSLPLGNIRNKVY